MRSNAGWLTALLVAVATAGHAHDVSDLGATANRLYGEGAFDACGDAYDLAVQHDPTNAVLHVNAACCRALNGEADAALASLTRAIDAGYVDVEHLGADTDLTSLHTHPEWSALLDRCRARAEAERRRWGSPVWGGDFAPTLDEPSRLAGLAKLWAEAKWNFANFDLVPSLDWDSLYVALIPEVEAATDVADYYRVLIRMAAKLKDGHTYVWRPNALADQLSARPGLTTERVQGHVVVTDVWDDALSADGVRAGQVITAIDDMPVDAYVAEHVAPYVHASTPQDFDARAYGYLLLTGDVARPVTLTLRDADGRSSTHTVRRLSADERNERAPSRPVFQFARVEGDVAYVRLNTFNTDATADSFLARFDDIAACRALVLDVRNNGGGNSGVGYRVLAAITGAPFSTSAWSTRDYRPAYRAWGRAEGWYRGGAGTIQPNADHRFDGPVAVLIGPHTYSAAEDFAVAFDVMERGALIGQATGGSTGQPLRFDLPGGGRAQVCTKRDTYPDGAPFVGVGIRPDRVVVPTLEDVRLGRDPVLSAALEHVRNDRRTASP